MNIKTNPKIHYILVLLMFLPSLSAAMGLRSFVALPVEKGGAVIRSQFLSNQDTDINTLIASMAYGIDHKQTLLVGLPYQLSPSSTAAFGEASLLYRNIVWQNNQLLGTQRLGLLGGVVIATANNTDNAWQVGAVYTTYQGKNEWDLDVLYQKGLANRVDSGRYDVSWQHRLSPDEYPEWGTPKSEWDSVVELNGRWKSSTGMTNQITLGLQRITAKTVIEAGIINDLNQAKTTSFLLSTRFHF